MTLSTGKRPLRVAEEFAFEQGIRNRTTVNGDELAGGTRAVVVDCARDQFFAGAALPLNQYGCPACETLPISLKTSTIFLLCPIKGKAAAVH